VLGRYSETSDLVVVVDMVVEELQALVVHHVVILEAADQRIDLEREGC
jgi:hypothetical protein